MKFNLQFGNQINGRLGCINNIERFPERNIETPTLFLYTKVGSVPHVTHEVLQFITKEFLCMEYPLFNLYHCCKSIENFKHGLPEFVGMPDSTVAIPEGFYKQSSVALWSRNGKSFISPMRYMNLMEHFQPDMYVTLADQCTNIDSKNKRCSNAVKRSIYFANECLRRHSESKILKNKAIIGTIEGGYDLAMREKSVQYFVNTDVYGFLIDGLFTDGTKVEKMNFDPVESVVKHTLVHLPEDKVRIVSGCWSPSCVLKLVKLGIDIFDTSLPYMVAERGSAFNFIYDFTILQNNKTDDTINCTSDSEHLDIPYEISLHDIRYKSDFSPLVKDCTCLTCCKHTRSYVHHLLVSREMLAYVLLMIHNIHYYLEFFKAIRQFLRNNYEHSPASCIL